MKIFILVTFYKSVTQYQKKQILIQSMFIEMIANSTSH